MSRSKGFGNAAEAVNLFAESKRKVGFMAPAEERDTLTIMPHDIAFDFVESKTVEEVLSELDELIGMESIKQKIREILMSLESERKAIAATGQDRLLLDFHILLTGNPGTGKTKIADKFADIFYAAGILPSPKVHRITPDIVKGVHVGDSEDLMRRALDMAIGGVLFLDEAYGLANDPYGEKAAKVLMDRMDLDRGKFLVIAAGYKDEIEGDFLRINPGFPRRFNMRLHIEDYGPDELTEIFKLQFNGSGYNLGEGTALRAKEAFTQMYMSRSKGFGNAAEAVNLFAESKRKVGFMAPAEERDTLTIMPHDIAFEFTS
jgi:SpoVK/Ycf46/Vps4 family AAA+-type ATPase